MGNTQAVQEISKLRPIFRSLRYYPQQHFGWRNSCRKGCGRNVTSPLLRNCPNIRSLFYVTYRFGHCKLLIQRGCGQRLTVYAISERTGSVHRYRALHLPSDVQETKKTSLSITGGKFRPTLQYFVESLVIKNDSKVHFLILSWNQHLCGVLCVIIIPFSE